MDTDALTLTLNKFATIFSGGFVRLLPDAQWLLLTLTTLEVVLIGVWWALGHGEVLTGLVQKVLLIGVLLWLVQAWPSLCKTVLTSFARVGILAGSDTMSTQDLLDPGAIAGYGMTVCQPILLHFQGLSGFDAIKHLPDILISTFCALLIILAFFLIGVQVFITLLEFYLVSTLALILVPFGAFRHTAFLAERALGGVISFGIKVMVLATIASAAYPLLVTFTLTGNPTWNEMFALVLVSLALLMLAWHAPSVAAGLMAGAPTLTAHTAAGTAIATGALVGGTYLASRAIVTGGGSALTTGTRGLITAGSAAPAAYRAGGVSGVAQMGARAASQATIQQITAGVHCAIAEGRVYGSTLGRGAPAKPSAARPTASSTVQNVATMARNTVPTPSHPQGGVGGPRIDHS